MWIDAFIPAFTSTQEIASMASTASFHTPSRDKLSGLNPTNKPVRNFTMRIIAPLVENANIHTNSGTTPASLIRLASANLEIKIADTHTRKRSTLQCYASLT